MWLKNEFLYELSISLDWVWLVLQLNNGIFDINIKFIILIKKLAEISFCGSVTLKNLLLLWISVDKKISLVQNA